MITLNRLLENKLALCGGLIVAFFGLIALFAPFIAPYDPLEQDYSSITSSPSSDHLLGTDALGRDVLSRLIYGARTSLAVGILAQFIVLVLGVSIGATAGILGGRIGNLLMRLTDIFYAFPDLLLIILLRAVFGGGIFMILIAIGLVAWCPIARLVRGEVMSLKEREFVAAARVSGASNAYIVIHHLLPNAMGPVVVAITFGIPRAIFAEAALSYIGIGLKPPEPSWGTMIHDGYQAVLHAPHLVTFPALAIALVMLGFTLLGEGLREAMDPRKVHARPRGFWHIA